MILSKVLEYTLLIIIVSLFLACLIANSLRIYINKKYVNFVKKYSKAIRNVMLINNNYKFKYIPNVLAEHDYDNEIYYDSVSCEDYLIYKLSFNEKQNKVKKYINDSVYNKNLYKEYINEIKEKCILNEFETTKVLKNTKLLVKIENEIFSKNVRHPITYFELYVELSLRNINGNFRTSKSEVFGAEILQNLIYRINKKNGYFYLDKDIYYAICRVERAKVTNKMRFAIYKRDNYRCKICGKRTDDLEIDHIFPIARGGKTTFDNLQTLCRQCNLKKGKDIYY